VRGWRQLVPRDIKLNAIEALGLAARGDAFEGRDEMILGLARLRHLELPRAVLGRKRAVAHHRHRVCREGPELDLPAHAMGGADPPEADLRGHQNASSFETRAWSAIPSRRGARQKPRVSKHEAATIDRLTPAAWRRLRPWPCAPCAARPYADCCEAPAS